MNDFIGKLFLLYQRKIDLFDYILLHSCCNFKRLCNQTYFTKSLSTHALHSRWTSPRSISVFAGKSHQSFLNLFINFSLVSLPLPSIFIVAVGFLIIPKKVEQNQTKIFDRDKPTSAGNYTVPNSISDSNKNLNSFKSIKNTINSTSSGLGDGLNLHSNASTNHSSNQLNDTELVTFFSTTNFTNITSQVGSIVEIPCAVHHLGEGTVSRTRTKRKFHQIYCSRRRHHFGSGSLFVFAG